MSVLCKRDASFDQNIIMVVFQFVILYLNILVYEMKQPSQRLLGNYKDIYVSMFI